VANTAAARKNLPGGHMAGSVKLAKANHKDVLARYMAGEKIVDIAKGYGCTDAVVYHWLLRVAEEEWKSSQAAKAMADYEKAKEGLDTAADALSLARARERVRASQWELERVLRRIYGTDQPPQGLQTVHIHVGITRQTPIDAEQQGQVIEGTALD
jgi:hypothetical protein